MTLQTSTKLAQSLLVVAATAALVAACTPAIESLDPVTLQAGPRTPSQVPATGKPEPLDFSEEAAEQPSADANNNGREGGGESALTTNLPPKRRVVSGDLDAADESLPLAQIARRERARRAVAAPPVASIDDKNIEHRAAEGPELIIAPPAASASVGGEAPADAQRDGATTPAGAGAQNAEGYWRDRVRSLRYQWLDLVVQEEALVEKVNGLRRDYYEEDDGYYRDAEIKPEWDGAWEDLQRTRQEIVGTIDELDRTIEDGRRAGALPGWLREGVELEPERPSDEERRRLGIADPVEPTEVNEATEIDS